MKVITTHLHADFDCLASMVAAKKLYPDAILVFPGSQEKNVREYLEQTEFKIPYRKLRGLKMDKVRQLIIVDASTKERIGVFAKLASKEGVDVRLYDHHVSATIDMPHTLADIRDRGSTVTIFTEIFREKGIDLTPGEATLMAIGLYEDTGSLTFSSVCSEDYEAARWLLEQGADLNTVSVHLSHELSAAQIDMLNTLIKNLEYVKLRGFTVEIATASTSRYIGDLSMIAHKLMDVTNPSALFVMVRMADRIHLIARSRVEGVDAGLISERFGGGGHAAAASATIKSMPLPQAVDKLKYEIEEALDIPMFVKDMMVEHVVTVGAGEPIEAAEKLMTMYDISAMPVMDGGKVAGLVTRQIIEKAIYHSMAEKPVSDFMSSEFSVLEPGSPLAEAERIILSGRQKIAPVVEGGTGKLRGLISRGMILSKLYGDSLMRPQGKGKVGLMRRDPLSKQVGPLMKELLPENIRELLGLVAVTATEYEYAAYVVGGFVRDLLLRSPNIDVDIVIEGDGIAFAKHLARKVGGRVHTHEKFKTAVVTMPDGFKLDVATARIEYYAHPAALPVVEMSAIRNDLYRRDFSVNAMAIRLNGSRPNMLIDFFGGQADLKDHAIRVLHNLSFVEDPTRAFRAVRFESRYGFEMGKQTLSLLKSAISHRLFNRLSGERLFAELVMILKERHPAIAVSRLRDLDLLKFVHPDLVFNDDMEKTFDRCEDMLAWYDLTFPDHPAERWRVFMMALFDALEEPKLDELSGSFDSANRIMGSIVHSLKSVARTNNRMGGEAALPPSRLYELFKPLNDEALLYLAARSTRENTRAAVTLYLASLKDTEPLVNGDDMLELGLKPSKELGAVLQSLMAAQLDGKVKSKKEALELAGRLAAEAG